MPKSKRNKPVFTVKLGNIKVPIYERRQLKKGVRYISHTIPDHSSGVRKLWTFADLGDAKAKANEIATAIQTGQPDIVAWQDGLRIELRRAMEAVEPTGLTILPACTLFNQAVSILGSPNKLLAACQFYRSHGADAVMFTPTKVKQAAKDFLAAKKPTISERRYRGLESYVNRFVKKFEAKNLHEITPVEVQDFINENLIGPL